VGPGQQAHRAGGDGVADGEARRQAASLLLQPELPQRGRRPARLHGLGAGLDDEDLAALAVLGPLDVHRPAVVLLDRRSVARDLEHLGVVERRSRPLGGGRFDGPGSLRRVHHLGLLGAQAAVEDGGEPRVVEEGLEDDVLIGIDHALHHALAEPERRIDHDRAREAGVGVEREHHAGAAEVGADHALDAHR
jgi:hypothetical protein